MKNTISNKRRLSRWEKTVAPIYWTFTLPNDECTKAEMLDRYFRCMAEVNAQRQDATDFLEVIRRSNGLSDRLVLQPTKEPDGCTIQVCSLPAKDLSDRLRHNICSSLRNFCSDVLSPLEASVRAGQMPRVSPMGGDSYRLHGRHAVYDLIGVRFAPLPADECKLPEHAREIVRSVPTWLRPMITVIEGQLLHTWIGGQTGTNGVGVCRAIVFGRCVLAYWTEDEPAHRGGCLAVTLGIVSVAVITGFVAAGFVWVPSELVEPLLEKLGHELGNRGVEITATAIVIALGLCLRKGWQLTRRVSCLEKHWAGDTRTRA
jgi:hypothetical protein